MKARWKIKRIKEQRIKNLGKYAQLGSGATKGENNYNWKGGPVKIVCKKCEKDFFVRPCRKDIAKYCSWKCRSQSQKGPNVGRKFTEEHRKNISIGKQYVSKEEWKGFSQSKNKLERARFRETMQKQVFKRDHYKCVICNRGGNLQVDHILSWAKFPNLRFSMDNCRTLCVSCHYEITFGKPMPENTSGWGHHLFGGVLS